MTHVYPVSGLVPNTPGNPSTQLKPQWCYCRFALVQWAQQNNGLLHSISQAWPWDCFAIYRAHHSSQPYKKHQRPDCHEWIKWPPREELRCVRSFSITPRKSQALKDGFLSLITPLVSPQGFSGMKRNHSEKPRGEVLSSIFAPSGWLVRLLNSDGCNSNEVKMCVCVLQVVTGAMKCRESSFSLWSPLDRMSCFDISYCLNPFQHLLVLLVSRTTRRSV